MNSEIVASAITSFNNAALAAPNFLWGALLMMPLFFVAWKKCDMFLAEFFPTRRLRDYNFVWLMELMLIGWLTLNSGNWNAIRDGVGYLPYINSAITFLLVRDFVARLRDRNPKLPAFIISMSRRARRWIKFGIFVAMIAVGFSVNLQPEFMALQSSAVLFGAASGYLRRRTAKPVNFISFILFTLTVIISMQPEYFRFGQLGHLTIAHIFFLSLMAILYAMIFVFRNFKPTGFIKDNHYKYIKWFVRLSTLLAFILFVMTESVPMLLGFFVGVFVTVWFAVKHARIFNGMQLSQNLLALMMISFGIMTVMPIVTITGIFWWKEFGAKNMIKNLRGALL